MSAVPEPGPAADTGPVVDADVAEPMGAGVVAAARGLIARHWPAAAPDPRSAAAAALTGVDALLEYLVAATRPDRGHTVITASTDLRWVLRVVVRSRSIRPATRVRRCQHPSRSGSQMIPALDSGARPSTARTCPRTTGKDLVGDPLLFPPVEVPADGLPGREIRSGARHAHQAHTM
ncbi:hypothetical protein [Pseudonocardia sp. HH130630-07]|uniref:hypothetical protein n=1 Tax=Pseudonocardia sp. HH130630-07 TaxID=1690815 RepID=UPI000814BB98|nr:hypothetical protein [Pseudonocardia sp. HH130630-07]ANY10529.1 hypothetical protein AFB00_29385 [Pseudonocardia sp. HH130630-07]